MAQDASIGFRCDEEFKSYVEANAKRFADLYPIEKGDRATSAFVKHLIKGVLAALDEEGPMTSETLTRSINRMAERLKKGQRG